jgi:hypothetical protein
MFQGGESALCSLPLRRFCSCRDSSKQGEILRLYNARKTYLFRAHRSQAIDGYVEREEGGEGVKERQEERDVGG